MPSPTFASDNAAGVHPEVLAAIGAANVGHAVAYGGDEVTARALRLLAEHFGPAARPFLVWGGTAANVLGLQAVLRSYHAVICARQAHINVDECGAPEKFTGCKLLPVATPDGKLTVEAVAPHVTGIGVEHHVQPAVISISQSTEYGTVYTPEEIGRLADFAHTRGMLLHMDGARLANAAAALGVRLKALTADVGVDVASFGGTKNGAMGAEAVIFFHSQPVETVRFIRKQGMQLVSKMRFVAAQLEALLASDLWLRNARHANAMARRLADGVAGVPGLRVTQAVQANAVFAAVPRAVVEELQRTHFFYVWDESRDEVRWMTSFATTEADVDEFVARIRQVASMVVSRG